ncbi:MAG: hypothetical protein KDC53_13125, partial [Saprospiraceae bacterium]|nr:hypothetical protein [Saprospiraceae bacterium]
MKMNESVRTSVISLVIRSIFFSMLVVPVWSFAQGKANISEYKQELKTYAFSDPDPVPILVSNPKIYPYNKY